MTDLWVPIPVAFTQAFRNRDIHAGIYALGCYLADASFLSRHVNAGVVTIPSLASLAEQFDVTAESMRLWLHKLKDDGWIAFDVRPGQRKPWQIELVGLATSVTTSPATSKPTSKSEGGVHLEVTSNSSSAAGSSIPLPDRDSGLSRPPSSRARDEKRREEKRSIESSDQREQSDAPRKLPFIPNLFAYTGCREVRGSHDSGYKRDPLGTDPTPAGWPHPPPTRAELAVALGLMDAPKPDPPVAGKQLDSKGPTRSNESGGSTWIDVADLADRTFDEP